MFEIVFADTASDELSSLEKGMQRKIILALERIRIRPERSVVKLIGYPGFKFKVGKLRLILDIYKGNIFVLSISGHSTGQ